MEKKIKLSEKPGFAKAVYGIIIAVLCITAIIVGIVAANSRQSELPPETPPADEGNNSQTNPAPENSDTQRPDDSNEKETVYISPVSGRVYTEFNNTVPVYSPTLDEWRVHTGIDISTDDGASVFAIADGKVSAVYSHPKFGVTVEITHGKGIKSIYSNLAAADSVTVKVGDTVKSGQKIGIVGDSAVFEIASEPHLHFEVTENDVKIDPLSIISDEAKKSSLGIGA